MVNDLLLKNFLNDWATTVTDRHAGDTNIQFMYGKQCQHTNTHTPTHTQPCCRASPHWHGVLGHCSASTLFVPESTARPERKRKRGRGNKEWLSAIIRPHMPEKGLISQEMREIERDESEREGEGTEKESRAEAERKRTPENCNLQL